MSSSKPQKSSETPELLEQVRSELKPRRPKPLYEDGVPTMKLPSREESPRSGPVRPSSAANETPAASRGIIDEPWRKTGEIPLARTLEDRQRAKLEKKAYVPEGFPGPTTILFITTRSDGGIAPKQIIDIANMMRPIGIRVFIAAPTNPPHGFELKRVADKLISVPARDFNWKTLFELRRQIVKHSVSLIHSHGRTAGLYARLLRLMTGVEVLHTFHGIPNEPGLSGHIKRFIDQLLGMTRFVPVFGSETEKQRAIAKRLISSEHESMILESAIDLSKFPKRKQTLVPFCSVDPMRPETLNRIRIGAFLRVESTRGHDLFLKAAAEAAEQGQWSCAGYPRERLGKFGKLHESLEVVGPVQDIGKWLNSLDVFVSTSTGDGQIYGALQAMAAGCVCILSDVPAHQAFVKHQAALLFDPAEPNSLAQAIDDVRSNKALRDMLLGNARYMLERFHNEDTFRNKLLDSYRLAAKRTAKA